MANKFDSVVMYKSWLDVAQSKLPDEDVGKLMVKIMEYGFTGKIPTFDNVVMEVIFDMAKPNIDSNIKKKIDGKKGGRKPGGQPGNKNAEKRITTGLTTGLSNGNANANANGNGNANVNANEAAPPSADGPEKGATASDADNDEWWLK